MKTHDELVKMTEAEREQYLRDEVESIISKAPPHSVLNLRKIQAHCDYIRRHTHDPYARASRMYGYMLDEGLFKLQNALGLISNLEK